MPDRVIFQRETDDWAPVAVTHQGAAYTGPWSYQIVPYNQRPAGTWTAAVVNNSVAGVNIEALATGPYWLFIRIDGQGSYSPVLAPIAFYVQ